jgi:hypothetical protein
MKLKSTLKYFIIGIPLIYIITLGLIYVDVDEARPVLSIFKKIQSDSALKVVDFSVTKENVASKPPPNKDRNAYFGDLHVQKIFI